MQNQKHAPQFDVFPSYKGGNTILYGTYIWEFCPGHALQNRWGFVAQHRLVGEDILGRPLRQSKDESIGEVVHHKDHCRTNNSSSNLEVMSMRDHRKHHARILSDLSISDLPSIWEVEHALQNNSIKNAAIALGWTHMTLRKHFPDLVAKYKRKSPSDLEDTELAAFVLKIAADPTLSVHDLERIAKISARTAAKFCKNHGVVWVKKSRKGEIHSTYRKKPTLRTLKENGYEIEPEKIHVG